VALVVAVVVDIFLLYWCCPLFNGLYFFGCSNGVALLVSAIVAIGVVVVVVLIVAGGGGGCVAWRAERLQFMWSNLYCRLLDSKTHYCAQNEH
jgi:uncharacterized membrane protein